ncbi:hypothetical protein PspLS_09952 [Pyricularia sp. CBS 133598]|nr:hypothetical protein PspLS_09952 [Pyricularia sp. CBS 133598]
MATQQKSRKSRYHLRQRASNILRRITKRQSSLQKHTEKTQNIGTENSLPQQRDTGVIPETPEAHFSPIGTPSPSQNDDSASFGTWLDAFEQTQSLYSWLARHSSFVYENETPFQVSNNTSLELDSENIYLNLPRNRMGLIVNPDLANSVYLFGRRAEQYTVRTAIGSRRRYSFRGSTSTSTGHERLELCLSSPLLCSSAGRRLEALADELLLSLGVRPSPVMSKDGNRDELESQSDLPQNPEHSAQFEGFSDRFSFSKPASIKSIISSCSPTQTAYREREGSILVDLNFFPELRRWVQKRRLPHTTLIFSNCKHAILGLVVGKTVDVPLTSPEGGRIPTYCNDCRLSKIQNGCVELARIIYDDFEYTEGECRRAAWHMVPLAVEAAQRATVERVMGSRGWGKTD